MSNSKDYMVYNYSNSMVVVSTPKGDNYRFESGTVDEPYGIPLTLEEIIGINMKSNVFKIGLLFFDESEEETIYKALKITDYKSILKDWEIEDIILNPSYEGYQRLLKIDNEIYFSRVLGVLTGLKSTFVDIPNKSKIVISARAMELKENQKRTEIMLDKIIPESEVDTENKKLKEENANLQSQIDELTAKMNELLSLNVAVVNPIDNEKSEKVDSTKQEKPKTTRKTRTRNTI